MRDISLEIGNLAMPGALTKSTGSDGCDTAGVMDLTRPTENFSRRRILSEHLLTSERGVVAQPFGILI